ncbi:MAG: hypothetical protein J6W64_07245 [Bacilli bacterium]|nr:hypothetical protein [Bacilli bacterium]
MRDINRIDKILNKLKEFWLLCPDLRFGQLLYAYIYKDGQISFNEEDDILEDKLDKLLSMKKNNNIV